MKDTKFFMKTTVTLFNTRNENKLSVLVHRLQKVTNVFKGIGTLKIRGRLIFKICYYNTDSAYLDDKNSWKWHVWFFLDVSVCLLRDTPRAPYE